MIVTLAGHVDHGKTSLVRALSGVDTDRLAEEKQRGLTIDLGFAYIDEGNIGFVDVPGHHKFIHNMVAGIASQQYALLVVAADDGPMPQSKEHLDILSLVGIQQGVIALTKCDRVDQARIQTCREEIAAMVAASFLAGATIIETSTEDATSTQLLLAHLRKQCEQFQQTDKPEPFRLAIDRSFNVRGAGLVVTGTVHSGKVKLDDTLHHFPSQNSVRVRSIRAQDNTVGEAGPGDRCALNLSGLDLDDVTRGDWICAEPPPTFTQITTNLTVLSDFPRPVKHWTPVHIYYATSHTTGRIALLGDERITPGSQALVDLVCDEPLCVRHADQLVIRDHSLDVTLGGGSVVFASQKHTRRRRQASRLTQLAHYNQSTATASLTNLLSNGPVNVEEFRAIWHLTALELNTLLAQHNVLQVAGLAIDRTYLKALQDAAVKLASAHQADEPSSPGMKINDFKDIPIVLRQRLLNALVKAGELSRAAGHYRLPAQAISLPDNLAKAWLLLETALDKQQAPSTGDLAKQLQVPQKQIETDLKALVKRGYVVHIANHRFYLPKQLDVLAGEVKRLSDGHGFSVKQFRDSTGVGRNVAIEILEYFDSRGFTRRQDNERIVLKDSY